MNAVLPRRVIHMTDFKKHPAQALRDASPQPLAVLTHSRLEFFVLDPKVYAELVERVPSAELEELARRLVVGETAAAEEGETPAS